MRLVEFPSQFCAGAHIAPGARGIRVVGRGWAAWGSVRLDRSAAAWHSIKSPQILVRNFMVRSFDAVPNIVRNLGILFFSKISRYPFSFRFSPLPHSSPLRPFHYFLLSPPIPRQTMVRKNMVRNFCSAPNMVRNLGIPHHAW